MINLLSGFQIAGKDVEKYCHKTKAEKVAFLVSLCKVDEQTAKDFVAKPLVHTDGKACCGGHKHESNGTNIAKRVEPEASIDSIVGEDKEQGNRTDSKRRGTTSKKN